MGDRSGVQKFTASKVGGIVLIVSGLAVAVYGIAEQADLGQDTDVAKAIIPNEPASGAIRVSEARPAFRATAPAESVPRFSSSVIVTVAPRTGELPVPVQHLAIPKDRDTLVRELQKELRRVGCYEGEVNGAWSPSTRRAMKAFLERVNASLPVETPDPVLYAMVQSQRDQICGKACPSGEGLSVDGRCVPTAIIAKANRKAIPAPLAVAAIAPKTGLAQEGKATTASAGWSATVTPAAGMTPTANDPPIEGQMALAGPSADPAPPPSGATPTPPRPAYRAAPARSGGGGQRWSRAIFSPRISNN